MSHSTTRRRGRTRARPARQPDRLAAAAPGQPQRPAQIRPLAVAGRPVPAGPAGRDGQGHLAHERDQLAQFGRGQLGEVTAAQPLGGRGDVAEGGRLGQRLVSVVGGRAVRRDVHPRRPAVGIALGPGLGLRAAVRFGARERGLDGRQQIPERRGAAEQRGEHPVEGAHLARVGHHRGQGTGAELGHRGGAHDRHGPGQPLAAVGADRQPRRVQGDPEARRHRGHIRRGQAPRVTSLNGADHRRQPGPAHRFLVLGVLQHRAQGLARPPGRPSRWRRRRSARRPS